MVISRLKESNPTHEPSCWRWLQKAISSALLQDAMEKTLTMITLNLHSGPLAQSILSVENKNFQSSPVTTKP